VPLLVLAIVVVLAVIVAAWVLGTDDDPGAKPETPSSSPSGSTSAPPATTEGVTADGMENFMEDYLATVTSDPKTTWGRLTPQFQKESGGFGTYKKFWSGYQSADIVDFEADPEAMTVTYTVEYLDQDGQKSTDVVTLRLEGTDGNFLIAGES
jgi:FlaG/FlaF family flagellin (archaellin)